MDPLWSIPPPFETDSFGGPQTRAPSSSLKRSGGRSSAGLKVRYSAQQAAVAPAYDLDDESTRVDGRLPRLSAVHMFPKKEAPWIPATKHRHSYSGCAPNGLRLFDPAPSLLLSRKKKLSRDQGLQHQLTRLKEEISTFEASNLSLTSAEGGSNSKSLSALTAAHGRMVQDLREMQQVVELRCASRWDPGLGRRNLAKRNTGFPNSGGPMGL